MSGGNEQILDVLQWLVILTRQLDAIPFWKEACELRDRVEKEYSQIQTLYHPETPKWARRLAFLRSYLMSIASWATFGGFLIALIGVLRARASGQLPAAGSGWLSWGSIFVVLGLAFRFLSVPSWERVYGVFKLWVPRDQHILGSRVERDDQGAFRVRPDNGEAVSAMLVRLLKTQGAELVKTEELFKPQEQEDPERPEYANFLFFAGLLDAMMEDFKKAYAMARYLYNQKDRLSPEGLKNLTESSAGFGESLLAVLESAPEKPERFPIGLRAVLEASAGQLGQKYAFDARQIGSLGWWDRIRIKLRLSSHMEIVKARLNKFHVFYREPNKGLVFIKHMSELRLWPIPESDLELPDSEDVNLFLLRTGVIVSTLDEIAFDDPDFLWFRSEAIRKVSQNMWAEIEKDWNRIEKVVGEQLDERTIIFLADRVLWNVALMCSEEKWKREEGIYASFEEVAAWEWDPSKRTYKKSKKSSE